MTESVVMFGQQPELYFLPSFCSWAMVCVNRHQSSRGGQEAEREGPAASQALAISIAVRIEHLGVEL